MQKIKSLVNYFSKLEIALWLISVSTIVVSFCIFDGENFLTLVATLIGVTSLIFCAKGNPFGQFLMILFSSFYGYISFEFTYYGEMLTYVGMTLPMAVFSLISWLKNPYKGNKAEVEVNKIGKIEIIIMFVLSAVVTFIFYFVLKYFNTANLIPSTISVTTSFLAVYLTFRRSAYYALAYATNDIVLIVLWTFATMQDIKYSSVLICFIVFLVNDIYGFINWLKMSKKQSKSL